MYPVSDRFLATLAGDHVPVTEVVLLRTDGSAELLEHEGGSVTVDQRSVCRRTCSVGATDLGLIPRSPLDEILANGARLRISRGVRYSDGSSELVPLGVFRIDEVEGDVDVGPVSLGGKSLECVVSDDKFTTPYRAAGTAVAAITALVLRSLPDAAVVSMVADAAIGARTWDVGDDPWVAAQEIAAVLGAQVYCDADGQFVIRELPDITTVTPVWTVAGGEGGVYISAVRGTSAEGVFNAVHARGESTETGAAPVSALVTDSDPTSSTYWGGPFGRRPTFHSSTTLTTTGACTQAATVLLRGAKAPNARADFSTLPNPALAPGDVLRVVYPDGTRELHQVASFTVPLTAGGSFTVQTVSAKEGA
ncbi:Peptidase [Streptomyces venezuelae ATCC 10712]|uniref:Peptidase n=1 Tax=Streptomyces venezuelae (strain ATCC 10712 / CBS 650.69 / DSM 40230 / JCM 4526 / NBRC 13096 / PD 04745) TaxID=953739 RepID=F2R0S6_STRVP|nr:DUF5047 domain-containing protein [Streptomyces venezuelae]QER98806.1 DUF5047 domain-containing protein [Streptomyces venezuelae ATCC 10712]CCA55443.1 Peptidase [Streptomyces venezuelae ATCC 10712]